MRLTDDQIQAIRQFASIAHDAWSQGGRANLRPQSHAFADSRDGAQGRAAVMTMASKNLLCLQFLAHVVNQE